MRSRAPRPVQASPQSPRTGLCRLAVASQVGSKSHLDQIAVDRPGTRAVRCVLVQEIPVTEHELRLLPIAGAEDEGAEPLGDSRQRPDAMVHAEAVQHRADLTELGQAVLRVLVERVAKCGAAAG